MLWWSIDTNDDFRIGERLPIKWSSVLKTYLIAYLLLPIILVLPGVILWAITDKDSGSIRLLLELVGWISYLIAYIPGCVAFAIRRVRGIGAFK